MPKTKLDYVLFEVYDSFFSENAIYIPYLRYLQSNLNLRKKYFYYAPLVMYNKEYIHKLEEPSWLSKYNDTVFFKLFRLTPYTFNKLLNNILQLDTHGVLQKKYRGGRYPVKIEKALLIFLSYIGTQETLQCLGDRFDLSISTVMHIINALLYFVCKLKPKYIFWPQNQNEFNTIRRQFQNYPDCIGAVDGSHINLKVPVSQNDSYTDRYMNSSINLMAITTHHNILTYVFIGFPGSAHDSRVFSNSTFARNIELHGKSLYFPSDQFHIIGDSAFPLTSWCMTPYKSNHNISPEETYHNYCLSRDRICIEHTFGLIKGRWRRLQYINVYNISKAVEIVTSACVLHNFCYKNRDYWQTEYIENKKSNEIERHEEIRGRTKRDEIRDVLYRNRPQ